MTLLLVNFFTYCQQTAVTVSALTSFFSNGTECSFTGWQSSRSVNLTAQSSADVTNEWSSACAPNMLLGLA